MNQDKTHLTWLVLVCFPDVVVKIVMLDPNHIFFVKYYSKLNIIEFWIEAK